MISRGLLHFQTVVVVIAASYASSAWTANVAAQTRQRPVTPSFAQNPFEGLGAIMEGQALMARNTSQAVTSAITKFKEAFQLGQKNGNKMVMGAARLWEGIGHDWLGKESEALRAFGDAASYLEDGGFGFLNPVLFAATGATYARLGQTDKALELYNRALPFLKQANIPQFTAFALKGLGEVHAQIGQKQRALGYLNEALALYRQTGDWLHQIQILPLISALKSSLGESTDAMRFAKAAVALAKENGAEDWEAYSYFAVGAAYSALGDLEQSAAAYNRSLELLRGKQDETGEATALNNLGLIYVAGGDLDRALDCFERALRLARSGSDSKLAAYATNNIATIFYRRGEPLKGFRYFEEALAEARRSNDKRLEAAVLASQADAYFSINSGGFALDQLTEAAATFAVIEEPGHEVEARISLADAYAARGRYREALDTLSPALQSRRIANDPARQGYVLREMAAIYNLIGNRDKALSLSAEALSRFEAAGDSFGQVELFAVIGAIHLAGDDYQKAGESFARGVTLARQIGLRQSEVLLVAGLGFLYEKQGNLAEAERCYAQEIALSELLRSSARIEEFKTELGNISTGLFTPAILLKFKLGKWNEAFDLTERIRARTFLDQLNGAHIDIRTGADPQLVEREQSLRFAMRALEDKLKLEQRNNPSSEAARYMAATLKQQEDAYSALLIRLKASNPEYAELRSYAPVPLSEVQRLLDTRTTLLSYFITPDKLLIFVVTSESLRVVEVAVREIDMRATINWFLDFASLRDRQSRSLKQLHAWLIEPIQQYIKTPDVAIVPHGVLHYVPFAALRGAHAYFGDQHSIYYLPSASVLPTIRRRGRPGGNRVLALAQSRAGGLPPLRFADKEAETVAKLYHTQPVLTDRATRAEFLKRASFCDVLHIAAHAELNPRSPLFSRVLVSPVSGSIGAIEVRDVYGMDLTRVNLVVLSACRTQLGAHSKGDEVVGLNRAFIYAGASSVIASLWTVDDEATGFLMRSFYTHLKRGLSKADALQAAQAATRHKYPHPYYWAAFVLTGDPGKSAHK
jgi:CHAT domain-containing protein/ATP/maltotriose-dependent transcriptional regulator MalT